MFFKIRHLLILLFIIITLYFVISRFLSLSVSGTATIRDIISVLVLVFSLGFLKFKKNFLSIFLGSGNFHDKTIFVFIIFFSTFFLTLLYFFSGLHHFNEDTFWVYLARSLLPLMHGLTLIILYLIL